MAFRRSLTLGGGVDYKYNSRPKKEYGDPPTSSGFMSMSKPGGLVDQSTVVPNVIGKMLAKSASKQRRANAANNTAKINKRTYIGGTTQEARKEYWRREPVMRHAVDSVAKLNGISPTVVRTRLDREGFTDRAIEINNLNALYGMYPNIAGGYPLLNANLFKNQNLMHGFEQFGLDDAATYIQQGVFTPIVYSWADGYATNEHGRPVHFATGSSVADNMSLVAGLLKGFRNQAAKDFPNSTPAQLDNYAQIYYNRGPEGARNYIKAGKGNKPYTRAYGGPSTTSIMRSISSAYTPKTRVVPFSKLNRQFITPREEQNNAYKYYLMSQLL